MPNQRITDTLLKNGVIKTAQSQPLATTVADAARQYSRTEYIVRVLKAPLGVRLTIKELAGAANATVGQRQLAVMLVFFNRMSAADQATFIDAYQRRAVVATGGARYIGSNNVWPYPHIVYPRQQP